MDNLKFYTDNIERLKPQAESLWKRLKTCKGDTYEFRMTKFKLDSTLEAIYQNMSMRQKWLSGYNEIQIKEESNEKE